MSRGDKWKFTVTQTSVKNKPVKTGTKNSHGVIVDFAVPIDQRVKLKESEKRDKYLDIARELKKKKKGKGT